MHSYNVYDASAEEIRSLIEIAKGLPGPDGADRQLITFLECCHTMSVSREADARHLEEVLAIMDEESN